MTCTHNHNCGCGSLSNANIKAVIEGLLITALDEKDFDTIELKNSIQQNLIKINDIQLKLNDFKSDMALNLSALLTKTELASIKSELENLIKQQQNIYEDLQRDFEATTNQKLLDYKSDIADIQREVSKELNTVQNQMASLVPTRDAYKIAVQNGYVGSEASWLDSLKGHSAYTLAKAHGFRGSEAEWLSSLKGDKGPAGEKGNPGNDGVSAYEVAKKNGFVGSEVTWLKSLIGEKGERGVGLAHVSHNKDDTLTFLFTDNTSYTTRSLKGEQGIQGPEAKSVYDIAVSHGFKGDEKDWLKYILENSETVSDLFADADSLEQFINGSDSETVLTRLSAEYPTLQKALKELFENGGLPATPFKTKALMTASSLPDGSYAVVTDDSDENNGFYTKTSGSWVLSKFNVSKRVQDYVKHLDAKVLLEDDRWLDVAIDKNREVYRYTDANGELHVIGLNKSGSVQSSINSLHTQAKNIPTINKDDRLLDVKTDAGGQVYAYTNKDGVEYRTNDIVINNKSVLGFEQSLYANRTVAMYQNALQNKYPAVKNFVSVDLKSDDNLIKRIPFAIKTENGLLYFYQKQIAGYDGDGTGVEMWKALINIDANFNATVVSKSLFMSPNTSSGSVAAPMLGRTSDGRIIAIYVNRDGDGTVYPLYQIYSSDEGVSWTDPTLITPVGTSPSSLTIHGTTGAIVTARNGRLILPMYTGGGTCFCIYSDDDGITWHYSQWIAPSYIRGHEPSVSMDLDDNLIMNIRPITPSHRLFAKSTDNGVTWQPMTVSPDVPSSASQGVIFRDKTIGAMLLAHATTQSYSRTKFRLMLSYDNGKSYPFYYQPFSDDWYGGYNQIIKWADGIYIIVLEYADSFSALNTNENVGLLILSMREVMNNVSIN